MQVVSWLLFLGLPCVRALDLHDSFWTSVAGGSLSRCMADPETCAAGAVEMRETAKTVKLQVHEELNGTRTRLDKIDLDFVECNSLVSQVRSKHRSTFDEKAETHRMCRQQEQADQDAAMMCKKILSAVKANRTLLCERQSLTESTLDVVPLCTPTWGEEVGMWLDDMAEAFDAKYAQWIKDDEACQVAEEMIPRQESTCHIAAGKVKSRDEECGRALDSVESFSCSWATGFATRCSSYDACFTSVLTRHAEAVREANASVARWRKSWVSAARMDCMADAMDSSGTADQAKMSACDGDNITNITFLKIDIQQSPNKTVCPSPDIYPGSAAYRDEVYGKLPGGLTVRQPTPCHWLPNATVDVSSSQQEPHATLDPYGPPS